jgi:hypothetical protein
MDPPFERIQEKSPLSSPYLISLSKLLYQLLVPIVPSTFYLTTGGLNLKSLAIDKLPIQLWILQ